MEDSRLITRQAMMRPLGETFNSIAVNVSKFFPQDHQKFIKTNHTRKKEHIDAQIVKNKHKCMHVRLSALTHINTILLDILLESTKLQANNQNQAINADGIYRITQKHYCICVMWNSTLLWVVIYETHWSFNVNKLYFH